MTDTHHADSLGRGLQRQPPQRPYGDGLEWEWVCSAGKLCAWGDPQVQGHFQWIHAVDALNVRRVRFSRLSSMEFASEPS
jgi:hypothetical protein